MALLVHHGYLTSLPLASNDWGWQSDPLLRSYAAWPSVWDPTINLGREVFQRQNFAPLEAAAALFATAGLGWAISEKILFFVPFAVLSLVAPWVLARELLGSPRWAVVAALMYGTNSYVLLRGTSHLTIATAVALAPLVFWAEIRCKRSGGSRWAVLAGLLLSLETAYDLRIALLTAICLAAKLVFETLQPATARSRAGRAALTGVLLLVTGATQLYWLVPLAVYHGQPQLPLGATLFTPFMTLGNGFTAQDQFWTFGQPTVFRTAPLAWWAYVVPLVAAAALVLRRARYEFYWLAVAGLVAAFLVKQDLPPLGGIYSWMFFHLPGWGLFREGSKLFWIVALAHALLVPLVVRHVVASLRARLRGRAGVLAASFAALALLAAPMGLAVEDGLVTLQGDLGGSTVATSVPGPFLALQSKLEADPQRSVVAWLGGATVFIHGDPIHRFPISSPSHPLMELFGTTAPDDIMSGLCPTQAEPFCYLQSGVFAPLVEELGVGYVVAPVGEYVGWMPAGVARTQLLSRATAALPGPPEILGAGADAIAVWRLPRSKPLVTGADLVARVLAFPALATLAAPALDALDIPAVYSGTAPGAVPDSIDVVPASGREYEVQRPGSYAMPLPPGIPAPTSLVVDGVSQPVHVFSARRSLIVAAITLTAGAHHIDEGPAGAPLFEWTAASSGLVDAPASQVPLPATFENERVSTTTPAQRWLVLRQGYEPAWQGVPSDLHLRADGLVNVYHLHPPPKPGAIAIRFATGPSELVGTWLAILSVVVALGWLAWSAGRPRRLDAAATTLVQPGVGRLLGVAGLLLGTLAMVHEWLAGTGLSASQPRLAAGSPLAPLGLPYWPGTLLFLSAAMGMLMVSGMVAVVGGHASAAGSPVATEDSGASPDAATAPGPPIRRPTVGELARRLRRSIRGWAWIGVLAWIVMPSRLPPRRGMYGSWLGRREVTLRLKAGGSLRCRLDEFDGVLAALVMRDYESPYLGAVHRVVDVGANIGAASVFFASEHPGAIIAAVEPMPSAADQLLDNLRRNCLLDRVMVLRAAVASSPGRAWMVPTDSSISAHLSGTDTRGAIRVTVMSLAQVLDWAGFEEVDLLKLDCEGAEYDLLTATSIETIRRCRVVLGEFHDVPGRDLDEISSFMAGAGFDFRATSRARHGNFVARRRVGSTIPETSEGA